MRDHFLPHKDIKLHIRVYESDREDPCIIFIPGITAHVGFYSDMIPDADFMAHMSGEGFNVIGLDLPGHGESGGPRGLYTIAGLIECVSTLVDWIIENFNARIAIMGSSLGGILSPYLAHGEKRIKAIVAHNVADLKEELPIVTYRQQLLVAASKPAAPLLLKVNAPILPAWAVFDISHVWENPDYHKIWRRDALCVWWYPASTLTDVLLNPGPKPSLDEITTPILVVDGEYDWIFPVDYCRRQTGKFGGHKDFEIIEKAGHELPVEHMTAFAHLTSWWLKERLALA